jgi:hypothetical protein
VDKLLASYVKSCPPAYFDSHLSPVLKGTLTVIFAKLSLAWQHHASSKAKNSIGADLEVEILEDKDLRELTRAFLDLFTKLLVLPDGSMVGGPQKATGLSVPPDNAHFQHIFSKEDLCRPLLAALTACLGWPDYVSCQRAAKLLLCCVPFLVERPTLHGMAGEILQACLKTLALSRPEEVDSQSLDLIWLCKEIYQMLGQNHPIPRQVFSSIPGVGEAEIKNFEQQLFMPLSLKKAKLLVKSFLITFVIGKSLEFSGSSKKVNDLPEDLQLGSKQIPTETPESSYVLPSLFPTDPD